MLHTYYPIYIIQMNMYYIYLQKDIMSRPTTASKMTDKQLAEYREAFDLFDLNKDNRISKDELGKVMNTLGMKPTHQELKGSLTIIASSCFSEQ